MPADFPRFPAVPKRQTTSLPPRSAAGTAVARERGVPARLTRTPAAPAHHADGFPTVPSSAEAPSDVAPARSAAARTVLAPDRRAALRARLTRTPAARTSIRSPVSGARVSGATRHAARVALLGTAPAHHAGGFSTVPSSAEVPSDFAHETSGEEAWGVYWAGYIHERAAERDKKVRVTEMWDAWDSKSAEHRRTQDHPERTISRTSRRTTRKKGQEHWDNFPASCRQPCGGRECTAASSLWAGSSPLT
jgi:hypothetical protein